MVRGIENSDAIILPEDAVLSPFPMDGDVSSLLAILMDEDHKGVAGSVAQKIGRRAD